MSKTALSKSEDKIRLSTESTLDKPLFFGAASITLLIVLYMIIFEKSTTVVVSNLFNFFTDQWGWAYIWATMICFGVMMWLAFGKYSQVKFGGPDAKVEFSTFSWIAMFFCSGIGTSLLAWASKEWYYYYISPPFGIEAKTAEAADIAAAYPIYHWGILGWVIYGIMAFPIGYAYWNRRQGSLRFSTACSGVIGDKNANGIFGKFIDFLLIFGLVGANATSLGSGTPMLAESVSRLLNIPHTFTVDIWVVVIWTAIFTTSVTLGLKKGIKVLSDINVIAVFILLGIVFVVGPKWFMINTFTDSVGIIIQNFFRMSFYTDPVGRSMFPQWWTVFYWAWYFAYAPYMGIFIARVSRGRTFREVVLGVLIGGTLGTSIFFMIFGNNALYQQLTGGFDFIGTVSSSGDAAAILGALMVLPLSKIILIIFTFVGFVYSATTIDSSAYSMATVSSKELKFGQEPAWFNRMFWALISGGVALVVMNIGGLTPVKTTSLVVAFPILIFVLVALWSFFKHLKADQPHLLKPSPEDTEIDEFLTNK
ncbi:L-carnitine/gamma-butyrobetaine antiporter [Clostridiales bacterium PH28_bin88]|nr:L-carnitine/gamma-butyrobetaine antiporter [Clostridiales bacterium PH28_bin88]